MIIKNRLSISKEIFNLFLLNPLDNNIPKVCFLLFNETEITKTYPIIETIVRKINVTTNCND